MALAPSLAWLFVGRIISGITAASFSTAYAYIADVTPPEKRAGAFGMVGAAFGIGFVLGPALGGILGAFDPRLPFWVAAAFSLANAAYGYFVLPESLPRERRMALQLGARQSGRLAAAAGAAPRAAGMAGVAFLYHLAHVVLPSVAVLYASYRYGWDDMTMGLTLAAVGVASGVVQGFLIRPAVDRFGERASLIAGLLFGAAGFAIYGLATTSAGFWAGIPVMALWGLAGAASHGHHEPAGRRLRAGPAAGRQLQPDGAGRAVRARAVHAGLRPGHRAGRRLAAARGAVPAGGSNAGGGDGAGLVGDAPDQVS